MYLSVVIALRPTEVVMSRPFKGKLTTPANTTAQRLSGLITAVVGSGGDGGASKRYAEWTVSNDALSTNMYIGGSGVSSTNYAILLTPGDTWTLGQGNVLNTLNSEDYWVRFTANSQDFHFEGRIV